MADNTAPNTHQLSIQASIMLPSGVELLREPTTSKSIAQALSLLSSVQGIVAEGMVSLTASQGGRSVFFWAVLVALASTAVYFAAWLTQDGHGLTVTERLFLAMGFAPYPIYLPDGIYFRKSFSAAYPFPIRELEATVVNSKAERDVALGKATKEQTPLLLTDSTIHEWPMFRADMWDISKHVPELEGVLVTEGDGQTVTEFARDNQMLGMIENVKVLRRSESKYNIMKLEEEAEKDMKAWMKSHEQQAAGSGPSAEGAGEGEGDEESASDFEGGSSRRLVWQFEDIASTQVYTTMPFATFLRHTTTSFVRMFCAVSYLELLERIQPSFDHSEVQRALEEAEQAASKDAAETEAMVKSKIEALARANTELDAQGEILMTGNGDGAEQQQLPELKAKPMIDPNTEPVEAPTKTERLPEESVTFSNKNPWYRSQYARGDPGYMDYHIADPEPLKHEIMPNDSVPTWWIAHPGLALRGRYSPYHTVRVQLTGRSTVTLFPPSLMNAMHVYPHLHTSFAQVQATPEMCNEALTDKGLSEARLPFFAKLCHSRGNGKAAAGQGLVLNRVRKVRLEPGQAVYIPPFWISALEVDKGSVATGLEISSHSDAQTALMRAEMIDIPFPVRLLDLNLPIHMDEEYIWLQEKLLMYTKMTPEELVPFSADKKVHERDMERLQEWYDLPEMKKMSIRVVACSIWLVHVLSRIDGLPTPASLGRQLYQSRWEAISPGDSLSMQGFPNMGCGIHAPQASVDILIPMLSRHVPTRSQHVADQVNLVKDPHIRLQWSMNYVELIAKFAMSDPGVVPNFIEQCLDMDAKIIIEQEGPDVLRPDE